MWSCPSSSDVSIVLFIVLPTLSVLLGLHVTVHALMNIRRWLNVGAMKRSQFCINFTLWELVVHSFPLEELLAPLGSFFNFSEEGPGLTSHGKISVKKKSWY